MDDGHVTENLPEPAAPSTEMLAAALRQDTADLDDMAHEAFAVEPGRAPVSFDAAQHLVSAATGEPTATRVTLRSRLARLLDTVSGPPPE